MRRWRSVRPLASRHPDHLGKGQTARRRRHRFPFQTIWTSALEAAPGTIAQVRTARSKSGALRPRQPVRRDLVGHVTKVGRSPAPRRWEHLVNAVLYFEGERAISSACCAREEPLSDRPTRSASLR